MERDGAAPIEGATREVAGHTVTDLLLVDIPAVPRRRPKSVDGAGPTDPTDGASSTAEAAATPSDEPWPGVPPLPWPSDPPEAA